MLQSERTWPMWQLLMVYWGFYFLLLLTLGEYESNVTTVLIQNSTRHKFRDKSPWHRCSTCRSKSFGTSPRRATRNYVYRFRR